MIGLDDASLVGRPELLEGKIDDIFAENGFIAVKDEEFPKLENPTLGTEFELNDHRGVIVGIAKVATGALFGTPTLYTTYNRAIQYIPSMRFTTSYILVQPKSDADIPYITKQVARLGYLAQTNTEFQDGHRKLSDIQNRHRHQHASDDGDKLPRRPLDLRSDLLHLHHRKPRTLRRAQSHGSQRDANWST